MLRLFAHSSGRFATHCEPDPEAKMKLGLMPDGFGLGAQLPLRLSYWPTRPSLN